MIMNAILENPSTPEHEYDAEFDQSIPAETEHETEQDKPELTAGPQSIASSVSAVISKTLDLEHRHRAEKEALEREKETAIKNILEAKADDLQAHKKKQQEFDRQLTALGNVDPAAAVFASHESRAISAETAALGAAAPVSTKRRGRPPRSGKNNQSPTVTAGVPPQKKKRGAPKGHKHSPETIAKMKAAWAKRKKAAKAKA